MKVKKTLFSLSVPPQVKGGCGSGWEGKRTEFHKSIHLFNNFSLLKMIHNIQDFQKCVKEYNGDAVTGADDILHRQCKYMLNNLNVLVKVLENLVAIQQQRRQEVQKQEKVVENVEDITAANEIPCSGNKDSIVMDGAEAPEVQIIEEIVEETLNQSNVDQQSIICEEIESNKEKQASDDKRKDCRICMRLFTTVHSRKNHEAHSHLTREVPCEHCKYIFKNQEVLAQHVKIFHSDGRNVVPIIKDWVRCNILAYKCEDCGEVFEKEDKLVEHKSTTHTSEKLSEDKEQKKKELEEAAICHFCNKVLKNAACMPKHMLEQHPLQKCPSPSCNKAFRSENKLLLHLRYNHKDEVFKFTCPICKEQDPPPTISFTFSTTSQLRTHCRFKHRKEAQIRGLFKWKHFEKPTEKCDTCNKSFRSKKMLELHDSKIHPKEGFVCQLCSKGFNASDKLNYHMKTVHSKVRASCELCGAIVKCPLYLKAHMQRIHGGEIRVRKKCPHPSCSMVLKDAACAKQHYKRIHTLTKIIKCVLCNKMFKTHTEMRKHLKSKVHTEPNYKRKKRKPVVEEKEEEEEEEEEEEDFQPVLRRKSKRVPKKIIKFNF